MPAARSHAQPPSFPLALPARIDQADLANAKDQQTILRLLNEYASLLMGREEALPSEVTQALMPALQAHPACTVFLAKVDEQAVGVATCFRGFSTFKARPLLNIHDLAVARGFQNRGIGSLLIDRACSYARTANCCAVTLEVQANNPARRLYASKGFQHLRPPVHGETMLFAKLELE